MGLCKKKIKDAYPKKICHMHARHVKQKEKKRKKKIAHILDGNFGTEWSWNTWSFICGWMDGVLANFQCRSKAYGGGVYMILIMGL